MDLDFLDNGDTAVAEDNRPDKQPQLSRASSQQRSWLIYFDIETVPDFDRCNLFPADPVPTESASEVSYDDMMSAEEFLSQTIKEQKQSLADRTPPDQWLDEVEQAENERTKPRAGVIELVEQVRNRRHEHERITESNNKRWATTPEFLKIIALGWAIGPNEPESIVGDETEILSTFWDLARQGKFVGYNILNFDLPAIMVRSSLLGIEPTRKFDLRPWGKDVIDLMASRFTKSGAMKLKDLAKYYEIEVPCPDVDGSSVLDLFTSQKFDAIAAYVESDVSVTRDLHACWSRFFC